MNSKELNTYNNFINSNNSFLLALESLHPCQPDIYIKVELLILCLNHKYNKNIKLNDKQSIILDLLKGNFYIEDERVFINEKAYTIEEIFAIVNSIDFTVKETHAKIFPGPHIFSSNQPESNHCQVINLLDILKIQELSLKERGAIFERNCIVNNDTLPFIREMRRRFIVLIEHLFNDIINGTIDIDEDHYHKVLCAFLKLYPFAGYAANKTDIPFEDITLPLNEIGLTKVKYQDEHLAAMNRRIKELNNSVQKYAHETEIIISSGYITNKRVIDQRGHRVIMLNAEIARLFFEYNEYSHNPDVLNKIFFQYIYEAFCSGFVTINPYFQDPVLKFWTINNKEVTSYIAIHLKTLLRVIDPDILSQKTTKKKEYPSA